MMGKVIDLNEYRRNFSRCCRAQLLLIGEQVMECSQCKLKYKTNDNITTPSPIRVLTHQESMHYEYMQLFGLYCTEGNQEKALHYLDLAFDLVSDTS